MVFAKPRRSPSSKGGPWQGGTVVSGDVVRPHFSSFRRRFSARQHVVGAFIKTPTTHATEIFGALGYDFVVIDEEHAPIDRAMTDVMLLAARASNLAGIVRVSSDDPAKILSCLDCGATGVLVPHVATVEKARAIAAAARYRGGRRGYSGSARAGAYGGTPMWSLVGEQDAPGRGANPHRFQNPRSNHGWLACITALIPARRSLLPRSAPNPPPHISQAPNMRNSTRRRRPRIRTAHAPGMPAARISSSPILTPTRARR